MKSDEPTRKVKKVKYLEYGLKKKAVYLKYIGNTNNNIY